MKHVILAGASLLSVFALAACEPNPNVGAAGQAQESAALALREAPTGIDTSSGRLSLNEFTKLLAYWDESIQAQEIEVQIANQQTRAAVGGFEPTFYAELNRAGEFRQTSAADFLSQGNNATGGQPTPYKENGTSGKVGIELKDASGLTIDLYYEMGQITNSLQASANLPSPENTAALGVSIKAPLLRNAGKTVNTADTVVAGIDGQIAEESVRLIKTQRAFEAIKTYIFVQRAQQRVHWRNQTADLAARQERELRAQVDQGLIQKSVLTQAKSEAAERRASLTLARQELTEQVGALQIYFLALDTQGRAPQWMPSDPLKLVASKYTSRSKLAPLETVFGRRPESRINSLRIEREEVRRLVAENQTKPEANLVLDYKKTQLSGNYIPFRDVFSANNPYQTWRIGFEYRRGLQGNITEQAEYQAALLREKQADLTMRAYRQRVASELNGIGSILDRARENLRYQNEIIVAQNQLLSTARANANSGNSSALDILRSQINLSVAKEARSDAIAQLNLSSFLASQVNGTLLNRVGIE
jgi:outer membrane protein TolC